MVERIFADVLTDYCQALGRVGEREIASSKAMGDGDSERFIEAFNNMMLSWRELNNLKKKETEAALRERELDVCSHPSHLDEPVEDGIFFPNELRLVYYRGDRIVTRSGSHRFGPVSKPRQEVELHRLCPRHLRRTFKGLNITEPSRYSDCPPNIISFVEKRSGRLMTVIGVIDVTNMPLTITYHPGLASYLDLPWANV